MSKFGKSVIVYALIGVVAIAGCLVLLGWICDFPILTTLLPNAPAMKFSTAVCFLCSAVILVMIDQSFRGRHNLAMTFLPAPCLIAVLITSSIMISVVLGIRTGIENLFVQEELHALLTVYPGRPSLGAIAGFIAILIAGLMTMGRPVWIQRYVHVNGNVLVILGVIGLSGYIFNIPALYYSFEHISSAMALHTAILFVLIGIAMRMLGETTS